MGLGYELLVIVVSAAVHETSHMAAGLLFGIRPERIHVGPLGLGVELRSIESLVFIKKAAVYLSGPAASLILAVIGGWLGLELMFMVNAVYCGFNLLPARTLDGGRFVAVCLERFIGFMHSSRVMTVINHATCWLIISAGAVVMSVHPLGFGLLCLGKYLLDQGLSDAGLACFRFMRSLVYGGDKYCNGKVFPVRSLSVPADIPVKALFDRLNYECVYHFYLDNGEIITETQLTELIREKGMNTTIIHK